EPRRGREERRDDRVAVGGGAGQGVDALGGWRREVVGRERADLRGELRAAAREDLVGVQARGEAERRGRLEDPARLLGAERAHLAEDIGEPSAALGRDARELLLD